jgi:hypothetical protein
VQNARFLVSKPQRKPLSVPQKPLFPVILSKPSREKVQFRGSICPQKVKFSGICLEKLQPFKQTFAGQMTPFKRTFGVFNTPLKPTFNLIS